MDDAVVQAGPYQERRLHVQAVISVSDSAADPPLTGERGHNPLSASTSTFALLAAGYSGLFAGMYVLSDWLRRASWDLTRSPTASSSCRGPRCRVIRAGGDKSDDLREWAAKLTKANSQFTWATRLFAASFTYSMNRAG